MIHKIENGALTVEINDLGAELWSVKTRDGIEYLWQGDARYWAGRASNLFPIVGRLWEGKYTYKGKVYEQGTHGFLRKTQLKVLKKTKTSIAFGLSDNAQTRAQYPFAFLYTVTFSLDENVLHTVYGVENTGDGTLLFGLGGHPGFNVPLGGEGVFEDYRLEFKDKAAATELILSPACFMTDGKRPFPLRDGKILDLKHSLFDNDAIVLTDMCREVSLKSDAGKRRVTVRCETMPYLGFWHKPRSDAPYVCIEPWQSLPADDGRVDDLETKRDMVRLAPRSAYQNGFSIEIV
ncbi:MAG: aldose 1-epimerase family protein [Clostridiales bacterium]|jgi:galactose mutarotase-like enzyme|nr:aldose 1-epimerase family protein [Clostridiales bacterium]